MPLGPASASRRERYDPDPGVQEPNIKNGCGGLRDYQNLLWMAFFKYRTHSLIELEKRELITAAERKQLETAYDFLLRVRTDLHYQVGRPVDVIPKTLQPTLATNLGYTDRSPVRRLEAFMGNLYTHAGEYERGSQLTERAMAINPRHAGWLHFAVFNRHFAAGNYAEALRAVQHQVEATVG